MSQVSLRRCEGGQQGARLIHLCTPSLLKTSRPPNPREFAVSPQRNKRSCTPTKCNDLPTPRAHESMPFPARRLKHYLSLLLSCRTSRALPCMDLACKACWALSGFSLGPRAHVVPGTQLRAGLGSRLEGHGASGASWVGTQCHIATNVADRESAEK